MTMVALPIQRLTVMANRTAMTRGREGRRSIIGAVYWLEQLYLLEMSGENFVGKQSMWFATVTAAARTTPTEIQDTICRNKVRYYKKL